MLRRMTLVLLETNCVFALVVVRIENSLVMLGRGVHIVWSKIEAPICVVKEESAFAWLGRGNTIAVVCRELF